MKNKEIKKAFIENKSFDKFRNFRYELIKNKQYDLIDNPDTYGITKEDLEILLQLLQCNKKQRQKINNHLNFLLKQNDYDIYFATFTFKNGKLKDPTDWNLLRDRIKKYIYPNCEDIILNVDYGAKNERMHAHAILVVKKGVGIFVNQKRKLKNGNYYTGKKLQTDWLLKYQKNVGNYDAEKIQSFEDIEDIQKREQCEQSQNHRLSNYMNKLVSHSLKVKQSYISTKKGTRYQFYQRYQNEMKHISRFSRVIDIKDYLFTEMNVFKPIDTIEEHCEREYKYLDQIRNEKDKTFAYIEKKKKEREQGLFDVFDSLKKS